MRRHPVPVLWDGCPTGTFQPVQRPWKVRVRRIVVVVAVAVAGMIGIVTGVAASQANDAQPHTPFRPSSGPADNNSPQTQRLLRELRYAAAHDQLKWGQLLTVPERHIRACGKEDRSTRRPKEWILSSQLRPRSSRVSGAITRTLRTLAPLRVIVRRRIVQFP